MLARLHAFVRFHSGDSSADGDGGDGGDDGDDGDDEPGFWNRIPGRQYTGRYAEAGGVTHQKQEKAIAAITEQAEELANRDDS